MVSLVLSFENREYHTAVEKGSSEATRILGLIKSTLGAMSQMTGRLVLEIDAVQTRTKLDELEKYVKDVPHREKESLRQPPN